MENNCKTKGNCLYKYYKTEHCVITKEDQEKWKWPGPTYKPDEALCTIKENYIKMHNEVRWLIEDHVGYSDSLIECVNKILELFKVDNGIQE